MATEVSAQDSKVPGETSEALPGIVRLGVPVTPDALVAIAGTARYGMYNAGDEMSGTTHQLLGEISAAWTPLPLLSLRGSLVGFSNFHAGGETSQYGEPQLAARVQGQIFPGWHLGGEAELRLVGAEAPSIDPAATSATFRALVGHQLSPKTWLAGRLGLNIDNSGHAFDEVDLAIVPVADRITFGASDFNAFELGLGVSHRLSATELLAEITADVLMGQGSPSFGQSPISLNLGARHELFSWLLLQGNAELSPSARPDPYPDDVLIPYRPRFSLSAGLVVRFGPKISNKEAQEAIDSEEEEKPEETVETPPAVPVGAVKGQVIDEGAHPLSDVKIVVTSESGESQESVSDANGQFVFKDLPVGKSQVTTETPGFDRQTREVAVREGDESALEIVLYPSLPAGQVKGKILDLAGNPVRAELTFQPGDKTITAGADGSFTIDLPPGRYTVKFSHPDFPNQKRYIKIVDKGVVVLNIALEK